MNYEDRVVCFLDILGFRQHIDGSINAGGSDSIAKIRDLADMFRTIREILDIDRPESRQGQEITQFSDSVVISFRADTPSGVFDSLLGILWVQINLVQPGYPCRGGVARGKLTHTATMLFGPALIDAYALESRVAIYPRVILDTSVINAGVAAHAPHHLPIHEQESILSLLELDLDGMYYINCLTGAQSELNDPESDYPNYLMNLQKLISSGILSKGRSIAVKYKWMRRKLVGHLRRTKRFALTLPIEDDLREAYLSITDL